MLLPGACCTLRDDSGLLSACASWVAAAAGLRQRLQQQHQQETGKDHQDVTPEALQQIEDLAARAQLVLPKQVSLFVAQLYGGHRLVVRLPPSSALRLLQQQEHTAAPPPTDCSRNGSICSNQRPEQLTDQQQQQQLHSPRPHQQDELQQPPGQQDARQQETGAPAEPPLPTVIEISSPSGPWPESFVLGMLRDLLLCPCTRERDRGVSSLPLRCLLRPFAAGDT